MLNVLLTIHIIITIVMVVIILIQKTSSDGVSGLSGSSSGGLMSGKASANLLTRTTAILATVFIANSLLMASITARDSGIIEKITSEQVEIKDEFKEPASPSVPLVD